MKKLLNIFMCSVLMMGICNIQNVHAEATTYASDEIIRNDETGIPDPELYKAVLWKGDTNGDDVLTKAEAKSVYKLTFIAPADLSMPYVANLKGIEYLTNLNDLYIAYSTLSDISYLKNLTNLNELCISHTNVSNISSLQGLRKLTVLDLGNNNIKDISALKNLSNLNELRLDFNDIQDISAIQQLTNLTSLDLSYNTDIDNNIPNLDNLKKLKSLNLTNTYTSDVSALKNLTALTELKLKYNGIEDISPLKNLMNLTYLDLGGSGFRDFPSKIKDISIIKNFTNLVYLDCSYNNISTLPDLRQLKNLSTASLQENKLTETELKQKMPAQFSTDQNWIDENKYRAPAITYQSVSNLKAVSYGKNKTRLTWNSVKDADGYLIYAQKNGKYGYVGMTYSWMSSDGTSFIDTKALDKDYNFYWVFPFEYDRYYEMVPGKAGTYKYAKGIIPAVTNLKAASVTNGVKLLWTKQNDADGYLVYGIRPDSKYGYIGMTTKGTTFTDSKASKKDYNFYWVFPYHKDTSGKMLVGGTPKYTYGRAR